MRRQPKDKKTYLDHSVEYVAVVVAVPAVDTEVLHSFGASKNKKKKKVLFMPCTVHRGRQEKAMVCVLGTYSTGKSLMWMSPMVVWMMALSETLLGPSACVAAITSSFEGFSLKMSLSESALFVSSGSLFENLCKGREKKAH